jgi:tRNA dimethylallyltransferase
MEIGTAKPSRMERARVPHHLIDTFSPDEYCTAGDYSRLARVAIAEISAQGKLPIVTGGTGLYLRALVDGLFAGPQRSEALRERLKRTGDRHGANWLHRVLARMDREASTRIHANDTPKLIRAIEICLAAKQPMTEAWQETGRDALTGYRLLRIGLDPDRQALYARINERAASMFAEGLVEETRELIARYGDSPWAFDSLGYRQARAVLRDEMSLDAAVLAAQQGHRNYAKRQLTWFRREPDVVWLHGFGDTAEIAQRAVEIVGEAMV